MNRLQLLQFYDQLLKTSLFQDYGPNGLQIEGNVEVTRIAFAVSATIDSIEQAIEQNADALIVHHGLFWNFHGCRPLIGPHGKRISLLIRNNINLLGYHLPLDAHPTVGNAAQLATYLGLLEQTPFGNHKGSPTGISGTMLYPATVADIGKKLEQHLQHDVIIASPAPQQEINRIGIITGGANSGWRDAVEAGLDAYITGEISEHDWHDSQEAGIHMFAAGHHATERPGILALMTHTQQAYPELDCFFIDSNNPA